MSGITPGIGSVPDPGLAGTAPGMGAMRMPPVSVCHQVSTMGQRPLPITRLYHSQAAGLMGAPTEPGRRRLERGWAGGEWAPWRISARIAVGDVYRMLMRYFSM